MSLLAAVLASALVLGAEAAAASAQAAIVAPARLRQGDPLLAWIVTEGPVADATADEGPSMKAELLDDAGKALATARCFDASALLSGSEAPLAPTPAHVATVEPRRLLYGALIAIAKDFPPGAYRLAAAGATFSIVVEARNFSFETIKLDQANTDLRTVPSARKVEEARKLYAVLERVDDSAVFAQPSNLLFPVAGGWRSAGFGDRRRYLYADGTSEASVHEGIDQAVVTGTPVLACARGKVVLAADREVTGMSVVIEHLPGLYSLYFHLSKLEVAEGAMVERGSEIARSGSTGLATGPHLHWELRAEGEAVDPEYWLGPPLLDKAVVTTIMNGLIEGR